MVEESSPGRSSHFNGGSILACVSTKFEVVSRIMRQQHWSVKQTSFKKGQGQNALRVSHVQSSTYGPREEPANLFARPHVTEKWVLGNIFAYTICLR